MRFKLLTSCWCCSLVRLSSLAWLSFIFCISVCSLSIWSFKSSTSLQSASICLVAPCGLSPIFLELPLFMGRTALIFQNHFVRSVLFRNFAAEYIEDMTTKKTILTTLFLLVAGTVAMYGQIPAEVTDLIEKSKAKMQHA